VKILERKAEQATEEEVEFGRDVVQALKDIRE